jgi:CheY-like chemotaxis protein
MEMTKTIFVVDDDEDDRMLMSEAIRSIIKDVDVVEVPGGADMYKLFAAHSSAEGVRLILMDMNMPRIDGLEMLAMLKKDPHWRAVPVIMISTSTSPILINKAYSLGVNAFMIKPVDPSDFDLMAYMVNFCFVQNFPGETWSHPAKGARLDSILVIEDNDDHWNLMQMSLRQTMPRIQATRLESRGEAMDFFTTRYTKLIRQPQFILLDLYLPGRQDGLDLLKEIRQFLLGNNLVNIPVIVFSYSNHPEDVNDALAGLANAYLVKPPNVEMWPMYFRNLCAIWSSTISLPGAY